MSDYVPKPVVVGVDGSPQSMAAVTVAADEAAFRGVPLRLVHARSWAIDPEVPVAMPHPALSMESTSDSWKVVDEARGQAQSKHSTLEIVGDVVNGGPSYVLIDESEHACLTVLGSRGLGGFAGLLLGSTAVQVATYAAGPVLVVRGEARRDGPIVVGVDGGAAADAALGFGFAEAAARGLPLQAVYVWSGKPTPVVAAPGVDKPDKAQAARGLLEEWLREWRGKFPGVEVRPVPVRDAKPAHVLAEASSEHASLVVVGTRMRGPVRSRLLGSVAHTLIHCSQCPLVIVHRDESGSTP
ncbi:MAG: universal stress protein [Stackebrandtia sp.]